MLDHKIKTFLTVCETMNYTHAAQVLNMTQPAVSGQIHLLEESYGVSLFAYHAKKLTLTAAGNSCAGRRRP
ncbi:MAG: LysR family transcriptional regulator [Anaerovoracaceae bacterium]|jgi:DNA-binding transcriptional LysR family regulator